MRRGAICWIDLGEPRGSAPALLRPAVIVQSDRYNASRIATVVVLPLTSNTMLARHPGNVHIPATASGLQKDSVINVSQPMTVDRADVEITGDQLPEHLMASVDAGLRRVVDL